MAVGVDVIADDPTVFYGRTVAVRGTVGRVLGGHAFFLEDQDVLFSEHLLVIEPAVPDRQTTSTRVVAPPSGVAVTGLFQRR
jgi:hypothetical protein